MRPRKYYDDRRPCPRLEEEHHDSQVQNTIHGNYKAISRIALEKRIRTHPVGVERAGAKAEAMSPSKATNLKDSVDACIA